MEKEQLQELIENNKEDIFSEIKDEISDDTVTDIEWDGYNLWITQLGRGCYISMKELSDKYMDNPVSYTHLLLEICSILCLMQTVLQRLMLQM